MDQGSRKIHDLPWKPANVVEIPEEFKDPRYDYYCANWHHEGRLIKKLREGWEVDKDISKKMEAAGYFDYELPTSLKEASPRDGTVKFRELIVLRCSKEVSKARREYLANKNPLKDGLEAVDSKLHKETGGRDYGEINIKRKEVK